MHWHPDWTERAATGTIQSDLQLPTPRPVQPNASLARSARWHRGAATAAIRSGLALALALVAALGGAPLLAAESNAAPAGIPLTVSVDPRVELISINFHLAGHPEYNRCRVPG